MKRHYKEWQMIVRAMDVSECRGETPLAARRKVYWRQHTRPVRVCNH